MSSKEGRRGLAGSQRRLRARLLSPACPLAFRSPAGGEEGDASGDGRDGGGFRTPARGAAGSVRRMFTMVIACL